jgi:Sec-independent protein translocase protein TatA
VKRLFELIERFWAPIAIMIAIALLGGSKLKKANKRAKDAGDAYRAEVRQDLGELSDTNRKAKKKAGDADQAAADAKSKFEGRVDAMANNDDDLGGVLDAYRKRVRD